MKIEDIRARKALVIDKLSGVKSHYDQWLARRNAAEQAIKRLKETLGDERRKQIIGQPNEYAKQLKKQTGARAEFEKADAWLETLSLPKADVEQLDKIRKEITWKTAPERQQQVFKEQDKLQLELNEISSRDRKQIIKAEEEELRDELDRLMKFETDYGIFTVEADRVVDHVDLHMAGLHADAIKFESEQYFLDRVIDACKERLA